jgi:hypothetical protein
LAESPSVNALEEARSSVTEEVGSSVTEAAGGCRLRLLAVGG